VTTTEHSAPRRVKYWQAINQTLASEMERDPSVCLIGEDVARAGGSFGATRGLYDHFGPSRVRDTPISELAITAVGTGAAMTGVRPIVEIMYMDFIQLALDQVVNQAAKMRFMSGGRYHVPLTILTLVAARMQSGPQHSQSFESWLGNVPGIRVVWPTTPADAAGLLRSAIRSDDPVVFMESLSVWRSGGEMPIDSAPIPFGKASFRRHGTDATIVSVGGAVAAAVEAAEALLADGVEVDVIDLRSISPLDTDAVRESVAKTGVLVTVQDSPAPYGIGDAVVSGVAVEDPRLFRVAPQVVAPPFTPTPFAPALEKHYYPTADRVAGAVRSALGRDR
jgi:pyruvate dehydrogenase E1 component beta subunit